MSYITERNQCVSVADKPSQVVCSHLGVINGSIVRPKNYSMYTKPIG